MRVNMLAVPKGSSRSVKILQHFKKLPSDNKFEKLVELDEPTTSMNSSLEVLDGSFSKLKPIGSSRNGPKFTSTPKNVEEAGPLRDQKYDDISEPSDMDSESECVDDAATKSQTHIIEENKTPEEYTQEARRFDAKSNGLYKKTQAELEVEDVSEPADSDGESVNNVQNVSTNSQGCFDDENELAEEYIQEVRFVAKSNDVYKKKQKTRVEILKRLDKYRRKTKKLEKTLTRIEEVIVLSTKFSNTFKR